MTSGAGAILVINAGSSSVKFSLFEDDSGLKLLAGGKVEGIGGKPVFSGTDQKAREDRKKLPAASTHEAALAFILDWIGKQPISAVAHRIVHGGAVFKAPVRITPAVMKKLEKLSPLAPLHQPHNLAAVKIIGGIRPGILQVACFDTAFHAHQDPLFARYALPDGLTRHGIRHYGFHGLSYEWIAHVLKRNEPKLAKGRVIVAHLGNGASLCALKGGKSVDTTMGMTALDGLPMGTRCGTLDPGAVIYMIRDLGMTAEEVEHVLYNDSGLKGLSGFTNDVRALLESRDEKARFALDYFSLRTAQFMGKMAVALGGVDGIVFTGGIGENAGPVRSAILRRLKFLKPFEVRVIPANEERMMAMHARALLN